MWIKFGSSPPALIITVWDAIALLYTHFVLLPRRWTLKRQIEHLSMEMDTLIKVIQEMIENKRDWPTMINLSYTKNQKGKVASFAFGTSIRCRPPKASIRRKMLSKIQRNMALSRTRKLKIFRGLVPPAL